MDDSVHKVTMEVAKKVEGILNRSDPVIRIFVDGLLRSLKAFREENQDLKSQIKILKSEKRS